MEDRKIIGLTEKVEIVGEKNSKTVRARIDTGAATSSIDVSLASDLFLGPIVRVKTIKSSLGKDKRPVVRAKIRIKGVEVSTYFTVADRAHMKYPVLIGRNLLRKLPVLIDPNLNEDKK